MVRLSACRRRSRNADKAAALTKGAAVSRAAATGGPVKHPSRNLENPVYGGAYAITERARRNPRRPAGSHPDQQSLFSSMT